MGTDRVPNDITVRYLFIRTITLTLQPFRLRIRAFWWINGGNSMNERVRIFDTTLRDGEQSPGCSMNLNEKVELALKLQGLGVDIIEAGFPIASEGDFAAVKAVATECRHVTVAALCRHAEPHGPRRGGGLP